MEQSFGERASERRARKTALILLGAAVLREHISVMGMCGIALILLSLLVPQLWQLAEKKGITLLPRHAVPAVRRA